MTCPYRANVSGKVLEDEIFFVFVITLLRDILNIQDVIRNFFCFYSGDSRCYELLSYPTIDNICFRYSCRIVLPPRDDDVMSGFTTIWKT